jgi:hypothetical protein
MKLFWSYSLAERPLLLLGVLMIIVGAQSIGMGILAEIQIRTYQETSHKPVYVIRKILDVNSI